jgi:hypothetical protein
VNKHREDGEEAIKRTSKVVPTDAGRDRESVQAATDSRSQLEKKKPVAGQSKRVSDGSGRANRER